MVQRAQNKMPRVLDGAQIVDRKSTKRLLEEQNMLSVNQMADVESLKWLSVSYKMKTRENQEEGMGTTSGTWGDLTESGGSAQAKSFTIDAAKVWNKASEKKLIKDSQIIGYGQKSNQSSLFSYLEIF